MDISRDELLGEIEMEFAADIAQSGNHSLKLLQVRPISSYSGNLDIDFNALYDSLETRYMVSNKALGMGKIEGMSHIVYIAPDKFDSSRTKEMAAELAEINNRFKARNEGYLLIGPGRWGSSDPFLGIPVIWSDISEAKMIVEYSLPGFQVEPSQGTHFIQNITS